jgi:hypothetical protein
MATIKVKITGTPEEKPTINGDESVSMLFELTAHSPTPKGLQTLNNSRCIVRMPINSWGRVSDKYKPDSNLLITGEAGINTDSNGLPYIEVIAINVDIAKTKEEKTEQECKSQNKKENKKENENENEKETSINGIVEIDLSKIKVPEGFLQTTVNPLKIQETIDYINKHGSFDKPIIISKKYNLLDGYKRYVTAKKLNMPTVPVIFK